MAKGRTDERWLLEVLPSSLRRFFYGSFRGFISLSLIDYFLEDFFKIKMKSKIHYLCTKILFLA